MDFKIPFTYSSLDILKKRNRNFSKFFRRKSSSLEAYLNNSDSNLTGAEYKAIYIKTFIFCLIILSTIFSTILFFLSIEKFYLYGPAGGFTVSIFILFSQISYPRVYISRKTANIEKNLIAAMQDMLVQLNSGVPIFRILVNLSGSGYGEVSNEFRKAVREINSGKPQIEAVESLGNRTNSLYFRRVLWQISNGMRAGSDMSIVIKEGISNLTKEQMIQIQNYGNKLNPLIMFYMLLAVILPALGITFLTIIASMINLSSDIVKTLFIAVFAVVVIMQIMFLGIIKTRRPSLL